MDESEEISELFDFLHEHKKRRHNHRILWEHVQQAEGELDTIRDNNESLLKNLKHKIEGVDFNISTQYVLLKERHETVVKEIEDLKKTFETLKMNAASEQEKIAFESLAKIKAEEELGVKRIEELKNKIGNRKMEHELTVEKLYNELELAHAAADLEQDEIETTLLRELMDLNKKIWRQQNANTSMQVEIDNLKRRQQAKPTPAQNHDNSLNPDDLQFFHLDNLADLFADTKDDDNVKTNSRQGGNDAIEQEKHGRIKETDHRSTSSKADEHESDKVAISKYQPLQIVRKRKPYGDECEDVAKADPVNKETIDFQVSEQKNTTQKHFEFAIVYPTSGDDRMMMTSYGQRGRGKLRSILKDQSTRGVPTNMESVAASKRAAQKVTFAVDNETNNPADRKGEHKRLQNQQTDKKSSTKVARKEANNEKGRKTSENRNTVKINPPKKLKLFNLDDLNYLDNIKMNSDDSD